ncbi:MAG: putative cytosolic protein [Burkholderiales bacterium]|jgi:hypothetical protein|nr:putative cytosolic protein [Burkholderiales bacterium]
MRVIHYPLSGIKVNTLLNEIYLKKEGKAMEKDIALNLLETYIAGWKQNDINAIIEPLHNEVIVIESHGPKYIGVSSVELWFYMWKKADSYIKKWDILSSNYCQDSQTLFCEWDFECMSLNKVYAFLGISVVQFKERKISSLHEYKMSKAPYLWDGLHLNSD